MENGKWRVWVSSYPNSYVDVEVGQSFRPSQAAVAKAIPAFKGNYNGETIEINARAHGGERIYSYLISVDHNGRISW